MCAKIMGRRETHPVAKPQLMSAYQADTAKTLRTARTLKTSFVLDLFSSCLIFDFGPILTRYRQIDFDHVSSRKSYRRTMSPVIWPNNEDDDDDDGNISK